MKTFRSIWIPLSLGLALAGCLAGGGGSGSEDTNGSVVVGKLIYTDGAAAAGVRIWIRPSEYLRDTGEAGKPLPPADAWTDARGGFAVKSLQAGSYTLEARDDSARGSRMEFEASGKSAELAEDTLRPLGSLEGSLSANGRMQGSAYVQVYGLDKVAKANSNGDFCIAGLARGSYLIQEVSSLPGRAYRPSDPVLIASGATTLIAPIPLDSFAGEEYSTWPLSREILVHTAQAGVTEKVVDFPLLVRLTQENFNFNLSNGKDFRFAGPDGNHLAYEVERWEPASKHAEIWIHLDSIPAGAGSFPVTMYWGKRNAPDFSSGQSVFSSFSGVWHMREAIGASEEFVFRDASPSRADAQGRIQSGNRKAVWGYGGRFYGTHYLHAPGAKILTPGTSLTLSAWITASGTDSMGGEIVSLGDNCGLRLDLKGDPTFFAFKDSKWTGGVSPPSDKWGRATVAASRLIDNRWHLIAGIFDGTSLRIYMDGKEKSVVSFQGPIAYPLGQDLWIGTHGNGINGYGFFGQIDEVQIAGVARSSDWLRLAYENQKTEMSLLEFP